MQKLKKTRRKHKRKQKETEQQQKTTRRKTFKNMNTGYPALDPTANKYLSGSGWEISVFCFLFKSIVVCFPSSFYVCLMFLYVFFDCKCKSLKRLGENKQKHKET